ncbi:guanylin isoform X3 [Suricata suricatta]|uniref:guanylin isoform X3 n=1 Tax=Suricata suricatta TaxID=37032 RepID=UPI00115596F7|nr:guanylin isoform X3 [Suricata suricatta]
MYTHDNVHMCAHARAHTHTREGREVESSSEAQPGKALLITEHDEHTLSGSKSSWGSESRGAEIHTRVTLPTIPGRGMCLLLWELQETCSPPGCSECSILC